MGGLSNELLSPTALGGPAASRRSLLKAGQSALTLDSAWVRDHDKTREAEKKLDGHFETWLKGERGDDSGYGSIGDHIPRDGETKTVKGLTWDAAVDDSACGSGMSTATPSVASA